MPLPLNHARAIRGVLDVVNIIAARPDITEDGLSSALQSRGYPAVEAEKLNVFVPSAFACAFLHKMMGVSLASNYIALSRAGDEVSIPIAQEHYFTAALGIAHDTLKNGWSDTLPRKTFEAVMGRSAEMAVANDALKDGHSIAGASLQPLRVFRFSAEAASEG